MQTGFFTSSQNSGSTASSGVTAAGGSSSPKELFTTLLVAQLKNQDPLNPTDASTFVNQLTQLSQMEALQNLATQSSGQASMLESLQTLGLGAQVGSEVMVKTSQVQVDGNAIHGAFTLGSNSADTTVVLSDAAGTTYRLPLGTRSAGEVDFTIDPQALGLPSGSYSLAVETSSKEAPAIEVAGTLQSVRLTSSGVALNVTHLGDTTPTAITRFNGRKAS